MGRRKKNWVTRKKFMELCNPDNPEKGIPRSTLQTAITAGRVIEEMNGENRMIDTSHPKNHQFKLDQIDRLRGLIQRGGSRRTSTNSKARQKKEELELRKLEEELAIKKITRQKMDGDVIPIDLVGAMVKAHSREMHQQYFYSAEIIVTDFAKKYNVSKSDVAKMKGELVAVINSGIEKGRKNMLRNLTALIKDYKNQK